MTELELTNAVISLARKYDILYFHVNDSRYATGKGFPDLCLCSRRYTLFVELKVDDTSKGYLKPEQKDWKERLENSGEWYELWRPRHLLNGTIERTFKAMTQEGG